MVSSDFVSLLLSGEIDLLQRIFFLLCGPDLLRCRGINRLWRNAIDDLTCPNSTGHAFFLRSVAWSNCNIHMAKATRLTRVGKCRYTKSTTDYVIGPCVLVKLRWIHLQSEASRGTKLYSLDLEILDRKKLEKVLFRNVFEKAAFDASQRANWTYAAFHENTLVVCMYSACERTRPTEMRFLSVCLRTYTVISDIRHSVKDGYLHFWVEWRVLRTGRKDVRMKIIDDRMNEENNHLLEVEAGGCVLTAKKEKTGKDYKVTIYAKDLNVLVSRKLELNYPILAVQFAYPIVVFKCKLSTAPHSFYALWNVIEQGQPAALWFEPNIWSEDNTISSGCNLLSPNLLQLGTSWWFRGSLGFITFITSEMQINIPSGKTVHPPQRDNFSQDVIKVTSSPWMLQREEAAEGHSPRLDLDELQPIALRDGYKSEDVTCTKPIIAGPWGMIVRTHKRPTLQQEFITFPQVDEFVDFWNWI